MHTVIYYIIHPVTSNIFGRSNYAQIYNIGYVYIYYFV